MVADGVEHGSEPDCSQQRGGAAADEHSLHRWRDTEMGRGKGVILQRLKGTALSDVRVFDAGAGLTWLDGANRTFTVALGDLEEWHGVRAQAGKIVPRGFPRSNKFGPAFEG